MIDVGSWKAQLTVVFVIHEQEVLACLRKQANQAMGYIIKQAEHEMESKPVGSFYPRFLVQFLPS